MNGWFLGLGIFCLVYMLGVGYGGIKKTPWLLKMAKLKLGKNMSDEKAAKICIIFAAIFGAIGVFLLVYGGIVS